MCVLPHDTMEQGYTRDNIFLRHYNEKEGNKYRYQSETDGNKNSETNEDTNMCVLPYDVVENIILETIYFYDIHVHIYNTSNEKRKSRQISKRHI